ncbi:MAG: SusD/RagB family nutrient-binding outer membrane lipoprotein [Parafilimonas sp.]|nr:SusD/RagB family nutrient-binding outer membrane lipoprotein [Parafilimonas sp.]
MKRSIINLITVFFLLTMLSSCEKEFLKENTNPTQIGPDQYDPNLLLTTVQLNYTGSADFQGETWETEWGQLGGFIQHTASTNLSWYSGDKYTNNNTGFGYYFDHAYIYQVQPVVELYQLTLNKPQYANLHQIARIMKALVFERITDLYGDVPYSQAGLGYYQRIYTPVYDKQQDIYADILKEVSEATDSLDDNADKPTGDVFYAVNPSSQIAEWIKFGYTLQLRMAMRLTKVDPQTAQQYVNKVQGKTFQSNDDNAIVQHQDGADITRNKDTWEINGQDSADLKLCSTYIDFLKSNNDPRLPIISWIYATKDSKPEDQLGLPPGYIIGGTVDSINITKHPELGYNADSLGMQRYSRLSDIILTNDAPNFVLTYAESEFLLADAAKRWGIGDAETHYNNGVVAALTQMAVYGEKAVISETDAQAYLNVHPYNNADALNQINTQYWACEIMNEYEAWINWRRTGYPVLTPTNYPGNITSGTIPRRLEYPASQKISNPDNYNAAIARLQGGDVLTSRMWIDPK